MGGPVVLLGQGEQYDDPDDWRELVRGRRLRRGVEVAVRRDGLTALVRPEEVPELAAVLDAVDPLGPPSSIGPPAPRDAAATSASPVAATRRSAEAAATPTPAPATDRGSPTGRALPTAAPRRSGWRLALAACLAGGALLLLLRLCARDGLAPSAGLDPRSGTAAGGRPRGADALAGCARPRGWIAKAACDDPDLARLRAGLARAYAARAAGLDGGERTALAAEQARWQASRSACRTAAAPAACLEPLYRARIAELGEARPAASEPADGAAPGAAAEAEPSRAPLLITRPLWLRLPTSDELADAYPERALRLDIDGRARLSCRVTDVGALTACDIVSEDPPNYGFGGAALRLSRDFRLRPTTPEGRSVEGARVEVPVAFRGG